MGAEAVAASTVVVAAVVFTEAVVVEASTVVEATEAGITARPAAAAMAAVAAITIPCLLAAHFQPGALATLTPRQVTEDTRRATVASVQQAVAPA